MTDEPDAPAAETPMIERAARALCRAMAEDERGWQWMQDEARAVIEALRHPGPEVIAAVEDKAEERYNACPGMLRWYGEDVWEAGIAAALGET